MPILRGTTTSVLSPVTVTRFYIDGTDLDDWLYGTAYDDEMHGRAGNDVISGGGGNDILDGGDGNDALYGGIGNDVLSGGAGNDWLIGDQGADKFDGGDGFDTVSYASSTAGVDVYLGSVNYPGHGGDAEGDTFVSVESVVGSNYADRLSAGYNPGLPSSLDGGAGDDILIGNNSSDILIGGTGNDQIDAYAGDDQIYGDDGDDYVDGRSGNDSISGGTGNDDLHGNVGNDYVHGGDGDDRLYGGADNDVISGGAGNDWLDGEGGYDILTGGAGADRFMVTHWGSTDILDFSRAEGDKIDLSALDATPYGPAGDDAFTFIGTSAFSGYCGEVRFDPKSGLIEGNMFGDTTAEFSIHVNVSLSASDFIL